MLGTSSFQLGCIDFGEIPSGSDVRSTVASTIATAALAERLGFTRYWLAEHHTRSCAWANPIPVLPLIGRATERIRIGTGGSLLNVYSPVGLASDFALLSHVFVDRIDLGIARGLPGENHQSLLRVDLRDIDGEAYDARVCDLLDRISGSDSPAGAIGSARSVPMTTNPTPEAWILGTSARGARLAALNGVGFATSLFHAKRSGSSAIEQYRAEFTCRGVRRAPAVAVAVAALCAETDDSVTQELQRRASRGVQATVIGTPDRCADSIRVLQLAYDPDIILFLDISGSFEARLRSLELLSDAIRLAPATSSRTTQRDATHCLARPRAGPLE